MKLSTTFSRLLEDMKKSSSTSISEDKDTRRKRREKRKEERRSKGFEEEGEDFNLNKFLKALEALKNGIISQIVDCQTRIDSKTLGGKKAAGKYNKVFSTQLDRVSFLIGEAQYRQNRGEGRKLEAGTEDENIIASFREQYQDILDDFSASVQNYSKEIGTLLRNVSKMLFPF
jgi:hypothetical protein